MYRIWGAMALHSAHNGEVLRSIHINGPGVYTAESLFPLVPVRPAVIKKVPGCNSPLVDSLVRESGGFQNYY